jgi:DNA-binding transcriptional regulator YiaG
MPDVHEQLDHVPSTTPAPGAVEMVSISVPGGASAKMLKLIARWVQSRNASVVIHTGKGAVVVDPGTGSLDMLQAAISETQTTVTTEELGWRRGEARDKLIAADQQHLDSHFKQWTRLTSDRARLSTAELLEQLADLGFAWRDIARVLGVSVQAIQKWRHGTASPVADHKSKLAGFLAACDLISETYRIEEIASWFEMRILHSVPVSPFDLWNAEKPDLVFDYASGHTDAEETLTSWDPQWRERYRSNFEVFQAGDGMLSIRPKDE